MGKINEQKILESHSEFKDNRLERVVVLVEMSTNDIRAICATTQLKPMGGYMWLVPGSIVNWKLLQEVADYGVELSASELKKIFPNWELYIKP